MKNKIDLMKDTIKTELIDPIKSEVTEAKNKINALYRTGDRLAQLAGDKDFGAMKDWVHAKKL